VPDNCKTAITRADYYDPVVNQAYADLARYYGLEVIPARVRAPQDKGQVEGGVGWIETWLLERLRPQRFESFGLLNGAIRQRMDCLNARPFQKRAGSRETVFTAIDRPALCPLPMEPYEYSRYVTRKAPDNYHVEHEGFYYSVPHEILQTDGHDEDFGLSGADIHGKPGQDSGSPEAIYRRALCNTAQPYAAKPPIRAGHENL
jgi:hypothetical protein